MVWWALESWVVGLMSLLPTVPSSVTHTVKGAFHSASTLLAFFDGFNFLSWPHF